MGSDSFLVSNYKVNENKYHNNQIFPEKNFFLEKHAFEGRRWVYWINDFASASALNDSSRLEATMG